MPFKAVIFDLDGTLLNTLEDLAASFNYALKSAGFSEHPVYAYKHFVGNGAEMAIKRALPEEARGDAEITKVLNIFKEHYAHNYNVKTRPYPGILELLQRLKGQDAELAVLSNKPHDFTVDCVAENFPDTFHIVRGVDNRFPKKPDPAAALFIINDLKISADETLYVGDTATDMQTAKRAGFFALGAAWGFRGEGELRAAKADVVIHNPLDVLEFYTS